MNPFEKSIISYVEALDKYIVAQLKTGPGESRNLENILAMAWYTVRSNTAWLVTQYNKDNVLIWQIVSTVRLLYETVADISYLVKLSDAETIAEGIIDAYNTICPSGSPLSKLQDKNFRQKINIGLTTEKRIQEEYGLTDMLYTICCQFTHYSFFGAKIAYTLEDPKTDFTRQLAINCLPDLLHRCSVSFARVELFKSIQDKTDAELQEMATSQSI